MNNDITNIIYEYLDSSEDDKQRLEKIEDLLHLLNFEKRLTELTEDEKTAMVNAGEGSLDDKQREKLNACTTENERNKLAEGWARQQYFVKCAWADYLNGTNDYKPFDSKREAERMWHILKTP